MDTITIYTDGACSPNPGNGGWAAILKFKNSFREINGFEPSTTNNRMEMVAVIKALECLKRSCKVNLFSDSMIVVNIVNRKGRKPEKRKNGDLVYRMIELMDIHEITAHWVRGHNGSRDNERADELAVLAIQDGLAVLAGQRPAK